MTSGSSPAISTERCSPPTWSSASGPAARSLPRAPRHPGHDRDRAHVPVRVALRAGGGIDEPLICYQGAAVVDPTTGEFIRHEPIPLPAAREAIAAVQKAGYTLNAYVGDELYVAAVTPEAERYADFQHLEVHAVGDLLAWLPGRRRNW